MEFDNIFEKILFVGSEYRFPKGGIASVINTYSSFIHPFKFVKTYSSEINFFQKIWCALSGYTQLFWKLLLDSKIEIVHIHSASGNSFWRKSIALKIAKKMNKKVILHCHGGGFKEFREKFPEKVDKILKKADIIVCLSNKWKDYFESIGYHDVIIIKNVINTPELIPIKKDKMVHFLFLGLISDNKGIFDVIRMLSEHKDEFVGKIILHIGGNGQIERLKTEVQLLSLSSIVKYEGWVDEKKKKLLLNLSDVYILPSYVEGVPISILEAESYHKPVITTNVGGIPSIVKDHESGLFVTPGNRTEIYDAMKTLLYNVDIRKKYGEVSYQISREYFPVAIKSELTMLYNSILLSSKKDRVKYK